MYEVNRSVFILTPLQPFWEWLSSLPEVELDGFELSDLQADANSYLLDPCDSSDEALDQIESRFEEIFIAELSDWHEDESLWPEISLELFNEWFDIHLSLVITDLSSQSLYREAFEPLILE